jgi:hypothetical protein
MQILNLAPQKIRIETQRQCGGCGLLIDSDESLCLKCVEQMNNSAVAWTSKANVMEGLDNATN